METFELPFEIKSVDGAGSIEGTAAGIGDVDRGGDRIAPGAFTKSLAARSGAPVPMLLYHDQKRPIGTWTEFHETSTGLQAKGRIVTDTRDGADAYALVKARSLQGLSIGYDTTQRKMIGGVRELHEIALHEISLVTIGMHARATVASVKSIGSVDDLRDLLHDQYGFSGREAKAMAGAAWKARQEAGDDAGDHAQLADILNRSTARIAARFKGH